jgi:hypothetical protein
VHFQQCSQPSGVDYLDTLKIKHEQLNIVSAAARET